MSLQNGALLFTHVVFIIAFWRIPSPSCLFEERPCLGLCSSARPGVLSPDYLCKGPLGRGVIILQRYYKTSSMPLLNLHGKVIVSFTLSSLGFPFQMGWLVWKSWLSWEIWLNKTQGNMACWTGQPCLWLRVAWWCWTSWVTWRPQSAGFIPTFPTEWSMKLSSAYPSLMRWEMVSLEKTSCCERGEKKWTWAHQESTFQMLNTCTWSLDGPGTQESGHFLLLSKGCVALCHWLVC